MSRAGRRRAIGAWMAIGTAALCLLTAGGSMTTTDAVVAYDLTRSLVDRHSIATSGDLIGNQAYRGVDGRYYSPFGIAQSVWNIPFYLAGRTIASRVKRPETAAAIPKAVVTLGTIPSVALLAWCAFALLVTLDASPPAAAVTAAAVVFATPLWPYSGFGFNQPLAALFLWASILLAVAARGRVMSAAAAGLMLGAAVLTRQEMFLAAPFLIAYLCSTPGSLRQAAAFAAGLAPPAALWGCYNWIRFGSPLESGYLRDPVVGWGASPLAGAYGLLFSSYASLLLYCPIVLLSIAGLIAMWRRHRAVTLLFVSVSVALFVLYASVGNWMGGRAYGPRYLVPLVPALVLPLAWWRPASPRTRVAAAMLVTLSIAVQLPGVLVDYAKVRVAQARAGETVAQDMRWSRAPLLLNARATLAVVPPAIAALAGMRPVARVQAGGRLDEALADGPDLWWNSLLRLGVIGRPTALTIAGSLLALTVVAFARARRLALCCEPESLSPA